MSCGIEDLKCGVDWLDALFESYEEVQIGMEVPYCIKNIIALKKNILEALKTMGIRCEAYYGSFLEKDGQNAAWLLSMRTDSGVPGTLVFIKDAKPS